MKFDRREIMLYAHSLRRRFPAARWSDCLRFAWAEAKAGNVLPAPTLVAHAETHKSPPRPRRRRGTPSIQSPAAMRRRRRARLTTELQLAARQRRRSD